MTRIATGTPSPSGRRHPPTHGGPPPELTLDRQLAAHGAGPLAHAPLSSPRSDLLTEPPPVVEDLDYRVATCGSERHRDVLWPGVAPGVRQRLADHAREFHPGLAERPRGELVTHFEAELAAGMRAAGLLHQRRDD